MHNLVVRIGFAISMELLVCVANAQSLPASAGATVSGADVGSAPEPSLFLPGDNPPRPSAAGDASGGTGARRGPPVQEPVAPGPSLALALEAAQEVIAACAMDGLKVGVSVIDSSGQPRAALTGEGTTGSHVYTGVRKALAALAFGIPGSQIGAKIKADPAAAALMKPNMRAMSGSVPLIANGKVIGAIGVSGASAQQDEKCAAAGAEKIQGRL